MHLVGAGPGDPGLLTIRGRRVLGRAEVVVYDRLVDPRVVALAPRRALRVFAGKAPGHSTLPQEEITALLIAHAERGRRVVRLKGGDPFVFGRGGEEAEALAARGVRFQVVPGVSAAVAPPAVIVIGAVVALRDHLAGRDQERRRRARRRQAATSIAVSTVATAT